MFEFFSSIASIITTVIDFIVNWTVQVFELLIRVFDSLAYLTSVVVLLPVYLQAFLLAMIGISVVLFVLGK